jgi:hypothetical protein
LEPVGGVVFPSLALPSSGSKGMISGRMATPKTAIIHNEDDFYRIAVYSAEKLSKGKEHVKAKP